MQQFCSADPKTRHLDCCFFALAGSIAVALVAWLIFRHDLFAETAVDVILSARPSLGPWGMMVCAGTFGHTVTDTTHPMPLAASHGMEGFVRGHSRHTHTDRYNQFSRTQLFHIYFSPSHVSFLPSPFHLHLFFMTSWKKLTCGVVQSWNFCRINILTMTQEPETENRSDAENAPHSSAASTADTEHVAVGAPV